MIKELLFAVYAALIPAVPLWGAHHFGKDGDARKRKICFVLFAVQAAISAASIIKYIGTV